MTRIQRPVEARKKFVRRRKAWGENIWPAVLGLSVRRRRHRSAKEHESCLRRDLPPGNQRNAAYQYRVGHGTLGASSARRGFAHHLEILAAINIDNLLALTCISRE